MAKKKFGFLGIAARIAGGMVICVVILYATYKLIDARRFQLFGGIIPRVETSERVVALTFDDGPNPEQTDLLLDTLKKLDVRATFFVVGNEVAKYPESARRLAAAGHELGNHSYSHRRMVLKSPGFIRREIERTDSLIRAAGYTGPIHFRPPYCKKFFALPYYLFRHHRTTITWDLEPESYPDINQHSDRIVDYVLTRTRPGSIILLHPWYRYGATREALEPLIRGLQARGYRFVTISRLLELAGT